MSRKYRSGAPRNKIRCHRELLITDLTCIHLDRVRSAVIAFQARGCNRPVFAPGDTAWFVGEPHHRTFN